MSVKKSLRFLFVVVVVVSVQITTLKFVQVRFFVVVVDAWLLRLGNASTALRTMTGFLIIVLLLCGMSRASLYLLFTFSLHILIKN